MKKPRVRDIQDSREAREESGQGLAEYALVLAFIAVACIGTLSALGSSIASSPGFSIF
jgi:Flp pilus assembly pilin Flp